MESSEIRRQSEALPSINYAEYERAARDGAQYHQRHASNPRPSLSAASPISPTTMFGPLPLQSYPQQPTNGIHTPPESRRTSDDVPPPPPPPPSRQSLPSLHEALYEKGGSFSAPQTPPIGSGSFSIPQPRTNSISNSMSRGGPSEPGLQSHPPSQPLTPHGYVPASQPSAHAPQIPPPPMPTHSHEPPYGRHDSQSNGRSLPPNPYSQAQPPPPTMPPMHPSESYQPPPPPPQSQSAPPHHSQSPPYQSHPHYQHAPPPSQAPPSHYQPSAPFGNGSAPPPPPQQSTQYPPYSQASHHHHHHHHQQQHPAPAPPSAPQPQNQPPYQPQHAQQQPQPQPQQSGYPFPPPQTEAPKGIKRPSGYGSAIERALSISTLRRDMEAIKEHAARIYHIVDQYQMLSAGGQQPYPGGLHASLSEFNEALQRSHRTTEALNNCHQVFQDLSNREVAEQNNHKMSVVHTSEYGTDDGQAYQDDNRSNGSQQPEKKMRRGRAAPPGRCHSCHRAETPEWRRGPDGARTLCNACGLHYAKLTRKLSKNPAGPGALAARKPNSPLP